MNLPIHQKFFPFVFIILTWIVSPAWSNPNEDLATLIHSALEQHNAKAYLSLVSSDANVQKEETAFINNLLTFGYTSVVLRIADQRPDRLLLHIFFQGPDEARFEGWAIRTILEDGVAKIAQRDTRSSISGLYKLEMIPEAIPISKFSFRQQDAVFHLHKGSLFRLMTGKEIAGIVFLGKGSFEFAPKDPIEQQQVELFSKKKTIQTSMEHLYIRSSPDNLEAILSAVLSIPGAPDQATYERALEIERLYDSDAFGVKVSLSEELWYPRLERKEFFCELKTEYGTLRYQHSPRDSEDVVLSLKEKDQIISYYNSSGVSIFVTEKEDVQIQSYDMSVSCNPVSDYISGVARIKLRAEQNTTTIGMRINPMLRVSQIRSSQGPLLYFQQRETNKLQVVLNDALKEAEELSLELFYQGRVPTDLGRAEVALLDQSETNVYVPPTSLYSNQARWYPQLETDPYITMTMSISVPDGYSAISNGVLTGTDKEVGRSIFKYKSDRPMKYFSMLIGRFDDVYSFSSIVPIRVYYYSIDKDLAMETAKAADQILRFYSGYFGEFPYQNLTIALRPLMVEGGHSPATLVIVNRVYTYFNIRTKKDPMNLPDFPTFLLAHELAHQWWGQAVGWRTYRDQWLSEGFAQFAATEFLRNESDGQEAWVKLSKTFQDWVDKKTEAGPLILGARLGHLVNDRQAYTALLYNKGAYVLNMLKLSMGPEAFSKSLQAFFRDYQFQRAGVSEFMETAQKYSSEDLTPFFQQWLWRWKTPVISWTQKINLEETHSSIQLSFSQPHEDFFQMKLPVEAKGRQGQVFRTLVSLNKPVEEVLLSVPFRVQSIAIDPYRENLLKLNESHR